MEENKKEEVKEKIISKLSKKFKQWRWKKNSNRMKRTLEKIKIQAPELTLIPPKNFSIKQLSPAEQIHTFYEIKGIKSTRFNNWIIVFLTIIIIILTIFQYQNLLSKEPDLKIRLSDGTQFYNTYNLASISHMSNGSYWLDQANLNFEITNLGQKSTNYMNFYVKDPKKEYSFNTNSIPNLGFDNTFFNILFWSSKAGDTYSNGKFENNQSWDIVYKNVSLIKNNLTTGIKELYLKVDCPGCGFPNGDSKCYSFKICISNSSNEDEWCKNNWNERYSKLKTINCPPNWWA